MVSNMTSATDIKKLCGVGSDCRAEEVMKHLHLLQMRGLLNQGAYNCYENLKDTGWNFF